MNWDLKAGMFIFLMFLLSNLKLSLNTSKQAGHPCPCQQVDQPIESISLEYQISASSGESCINN